MKNIKYGDAKAVAREGEKYVSPVQSKGASVSHPLNAKRVIAVSCSDLHLSHTAPVSRADADWYGAQAAALGQLRIIANTHGAPVICAGDVFDKAVCPPELVNFAIRNLPRYMIAVPGQHDLPHHRYADVHKSAYWTLVEAGKIINLDTGRDGKWSAINGAVVSGFPWERPVCPPPSQPLDGINIAIIHAYIWKKGRCYPGAPEEAHLLRWRERLKGYRVAVLGDNHSGFLVKGDELTILNGGGFMRRKSDERDYKPSVGLIWSDGDVTREYLDTSKDVLLEKEEVIAKVVEKHGDFEEFLEGVRSLQNCNADFVDAVREAMDRKKTPAHVRDLVNIAVGGVK